MFLSQAVILNVHSECDHARNVIKSEWTHIQLGCKGSHVPAKVVAISDVFSQRTSILVKKILNVLFYKNCQFDFHIFH